MGLIAVGRCIGVLSYESGQPVTQRKQQPNDSETGNDS